jgi:DNA-binding Lrp family transcriptional regulator
MDREVEGVDEVDAALLRLLQQDGRRTNRQLAAELGVAESTCLERTRALIRRGVVTGVHAHVDLQKTGRPVQAMVAVRIRLPERAMIDAFHGYVLSLPETLAVFVMSGADDFLIHVAVRDNNQLSGFVLDRLSQRREIADVRTSIIFRHHRRDVLDVETGQPDHA